MFEKFEIIFVDDKDEDKDADELDEARVTKLLASLPINSYNRLLIFNLSIFYFNCKAP